MRTRVRISNEFSAIENTSDLKFSRNTKTFGKTLICWCYYPTGMDWREDDLNFDAYQQKSRGYQNLLFIIILTHLLSLPHNILKLILNAKNHHLIDEVTPFYVSL